MKTTSKTLSVAAFTCFGLIAASAPAWSETVFLTNNTSPKALASNEGDAGTGLTTGSSDDGNNNGLDRDRTGASTVLTLSADDGGGTITFNTVDVSGNNELFMDGTSMGHGNAKWGNSQNWTFTLDKAISFDALNFQVNENSFSLRSVAWKDDAAASGPGWSFSSDGTIGIFSFTNGQFYDFTSAGVSDVPAGTGIGFGAFGGANGGELLRSFTISLANGSTTPAGPFPLFISPHAGIPGNYDFSWDSQDGKIYDLVSATDLAASPDTWDVWQGQGDLAADPPTNTLTDIAGGGDSRRFFAVVERDAPPPPPLLNEDFEGGAIPTGWTFSGTGTTWSVGTPNGDGGANTEPSAAAGGTFCAGTNMNGKYANSADARLVTTAFTVPAGGATLELDYYIDTEAASGGPDFGTIRLLNAADGTPLAGGEVASDLQGTSLSWNLGESLALPAAANGLEVKLEFGFVSDDAGDNWAGFYIDDVVVTAD